MSFRKNRVLIPICSAALLLTSCETADQKHANTAPPPQATAPAIAQPPAAPPTAAPKPDPVEATIAAAENEYQAGEASYLAGHLEAAKQHFDNAFNLLTTGPLDIRSNDRLQAEFDKIVEGTRKYELEALKEGDGFSEQKAEPAPIDEANDVTFPVDPRVKAQAEAELKRTHSDLPLVMNDYVASYVNYYSSRGHGVVERALVRAGRYRPLIERVLREEGVPQDLIYLAQAESGFQPLALSRAGARGMWQFIAGRASEYGLERNWWIDERQDPEKSTRAAARHLKDLYADFGDWYLAIAAYNTGPVNVQNAVQRTGFADFWELYRRNVLPKETKNYVPIILAMTIIAKNPAQYGLLDIQPEPPLDVDRVTIDYPVDIRLVAECVETSVATLQDLNPSLLRMTTPRQGSFELRLPPGTAQRYEEAIAAIPVENRVWWRYHQVIVGESLASIARQYHTTTQAITEVNGLDESEIGPATRLIIPIAAGQHAPGEVDSQAFSRHPTRYKVRSGDTVLSVADDFGVPPERLRKWNRLSGNTLRKGRILVVYRPLSKPEPKVAVSKSRSAKKLKNPTKASASKPHTSVPAQKQAALPSSASAGPDR